MKKIELQNICKNLGKGGQSRLAEILGWQPSTICRKIKGESKITLSDALAIQSAIKKGG